MKSVTATKRTKRWIGGVVFVLAVGWAGQAQAQIGVGTWTRTDLKGVGITMTVEACCNGGLRFTYHISVPNQPPTTMTVDSPMNETEVPAVIGGKPSGQTMAIKRVDDHHYSAVLKMNGAVSMTANGIVSADGKTLTVEDIQAGDKGKTIETWVRK